MEHYGGGAGCKSPFSDFGVLTMLILVIVGWRVPEALGRQAGLEAGWDSGWRRGRAGCGRLLWEPVVAGEQVSPEIENGGLDWLQGYFKEMDLRYAIAGVFYSLRGG